MNIPLRTDLIKDEGAQRRRKTKKNLLKVVTSERRFDNL